MKQHTKIGGTSALSAEEQRKIRRLSEIKIAAMLLFVILLAIFGSIAWFTMSREAEGGGVQLSATEAPYEIVSPSGKVSKYDSFRSLLGQSEANVWEMTAQNNLNNFSEEDDGIGPGSYGVISFYVKSKVEYVDLDLNFQIVGYHYEAATEEHSAQMTPVQNLDAFLGGHILLFEERTGSEGAYVYSKPILSDAQLNRTLKNRRFWKSGNDTPINIYWVWGKTLSVLVEATSVNGVEVLPLCRKPEENVETSDYWKILSDIIAHPDRYFYGQVTETVSEANMVSHYDSFSDKYDLADNQIGMSVNYITLRLSAAQTTGEGA